MCKYKTKNKKLYVGGNMSDKKVEWTNPFNNEKLIHKERKDGMIDFFYGPKDKAGEKNHGHTIFDNHNVIFNRNPKGE